MVRNDDFSKLVKVKLADRVGHKCSNPSCRRTTSGAAFGSTDASVNIGVAAHISAASTGGPRFNGQIPSAVRSSIDNAIWLCQTCAKLVDSDSKKYTVEKLKEWKDDAEKEAQLDLQTRLPNAENVDSEIKRAEQDILIGAIEGYEGNMIVFRELNGWDVVGLVGENYNTDQHERTLYVQAMLHLLEEGFVRNRGGQSAYELTYLGLKRANDLRAQGVIRNKPGNFVCDTSQ